MSDGFCEMKLFQVRPDKVDDFEALILTVAEGQRAQPGCTGLRYMKRFYTIDGVEPGAPPRELTKIVKCVKYYSYWEFDTKEHYGKAIDWMFRSHGKEMMRLLIMPFEIGCGERVW